MGNISFKISFDISLDKNQEIYLVSSLKKELEEKNSRISFLENQIKNADSNQNQDLLQECKQIFRSIKHEKETPVEITEDIINENDEETEPEELLVKEDIKPKKVLNSKNKKKVKN